MVTKKQGKKIMEKIVQAFSFVEENPNLIKDRHLSEQDITTKFVLPMLASLNWDIFRIDEKGPEVHEKAYREKSDVGKGLPDIILKSKNKTVYVEVKRPPLPPKIPNLERYDDSNFIVLTSFEDLRIFTCRGKNKLKLRFETNFNRYVEEFDKLWGILSNTKKGKETRAGYKATR